MQQDAWRAYLELALGLTETPLKKAQTVVRRVVGSGGATAAQLQELAEELVSTGLANREALTKIVRFEVDRALGLVGLATAEEVADLTERVRQLERELRVAKATSGGPARPAAEVPPPGARPVAKKAIAKKAVAKKAVAGQTSRAEDPGAGGTGRPRTAPGSKHVDVRRLPATPAERGARRAEAGEES